MMGKSEMRIFVCAALTLFSTVANAAPVSYAAQLETSRQNPVTDILILESDSAGTVHATVYGQDLPGKGHVVIRHDPPFDPVHTLVIGLTEGEDELGNDKTQIVMFLAPGFASSNRGVPYSSVFPGARHSQTISSLAAALGGDAVELAWFTDTFFSGPAAGAPFDSDGAFTVAEFTVLDPIGGSEARSTFTVSKDWADDNPGEVEVTISCNTGLPIEQSQAISENDGVEFVVVEYDDGELDCEITEAVPAGYSAVYFDGVTNSSTSCQYLDVTGVAEFTCSITNSPDPVEVVITKDWVFEGSSEPQEIDQRYELVLWCDAEIVDGYQVIGSGVEAPSGNGPGCGLIAKNLEGAQTVGFADWCKPFFGEGSDTFPAEVIPEYPDSHCYVVETVFDDAVEVDNGCSNLTVSAGQGASCTITNTVFFEGIPTLDRYGLALLALLVLGAGLAGFRRFA